MLPIHTVAAGGGSVLRFDGRRLQVGPVSAGADPGPAAYRRGGPLTITDANVLLGRLPLAALPAVFGPQGDQPADDEAVRRGFAELAVAMAGVVPGISSERVAAGALQIAIETMAEALRRISIQRGHDLREALLVSYGGAGGQHACRLAEVLGVTRVLLHPLAGVLSAYGLGMAEQRLLLECSPRLPLRPDTLPLLRQCCAELVQQGLADLRRLGDLAEGATGRIGVRLELRAAGRERGLEVAWAPDEDGVVALQEAFAAAYLQRFGYRPVGEDWIVERLLVELAPPAVVGGLAVVGGQAAAAAPLAPTTPLWLGEAAGWRPVPLWQRSQLQPQQRLDGPALVVDATTTTVLEPGWQALVLADGALLLEREGAAAASSGVDQAVEHVEQRPDPTLLELYNHRFAAIAEQMGARLQQSARSVNIRERLDFSCALFDAAGQLVANAPHIPVHLGSMGDSVASLLAAIARGERPPLAPGDVVLSNNPYNGGTHLPDITVITPVLNIRYKFGKIYFICSI
jgi:5-oxoprolinase (ATP-hydrolysing)